MGKKRSEYPFSFKFYFLWESRIYLLENFTVLVTFLSHFSILQDDRGNEFYRYNEFLEQDNLSAIFLMIEEFGMIWINIIILHFI